MINSDDIMAILKANGPSTCGQVARALMIPPQEAREWLEAMKDRGEVSHNWITGRYSV